jgi:hypothetical protein
MEFEHCTYVGDAIDPGDHGLDEVPAPLAAILRQTNGLIAYGGGFHLRGLASSPEWHSLHAAWRGPAAIHRLFESVLPTDVPFGQDALGDQFVLRDGVVSRLSAETGELQQTGHGLIGFLEAVVADPDGTLGLEPLRRFERAGGTLEPGQLLNVYPPFVFATETPAARSFRAISALEQVAYLADIARQTAALPDGEQVRLKIVPGEA